MTIRAKFDARLGEFRLNVDLEIPSFGISALFGASGSGKSMLLRAIAGLDRVPGGYLEVAGETWQNGQTFLPPHRRAVGYVFQESSLFPHLDVRGNLGYGKKRAPAGVPGIALDQVIELLGIGHLLGRDPLTLSGGERQRVAIARALAANPGLLLMDEPLASLDLERKREILPYLESMHRDLEIPVVYVSHDPGEVARLADHVALMDAGAILADGSVQEIFTRLDLPLARGDDAAAVVEAEVAGHDEEYHLTRLGFAGQELLIARHDLPEGSTARLRIAARDVSVTLEPQTGTSILNILPATVDALEPEGESQVTVRLLVDNSPLLARVTRKSASLLGLEPGQRVYAQVKSIALL